MKRRHAGITVLCVIASLAVFAWVAIFRHPHGLAWPAVHRFVSRTFVWPVQGLVLQTVVTPQFALVISVTLLLERLFPAQPNRRIFSVSFVQDLIWFFYETVMETIIIVTWVAFLTVVYQRYFSSLTITAAAAWPGWLRIVVGAFLLDLLYWGQHYTHHRVAPLWQLHAVHHSQKQLNFFTDFRYHILEYVVRRTWIVVPFLVLGVSLSAIVYFAIFQRWYTRFYHANIRTNLGPLRWVLVTPQSHRIHHSIEPHHHDRNFGSLLCVWDHLFRTQYYGFDEYPETGIDDVSFPHEERVSVKLLVGPLIQMAHPFRSLRRSAPS